MNSNTRFRSNFIVIAVVVALIVVYVIGAYGHIRRDPNRMPGFSGMVTAVSLDSFTMRNGRGVETLVHVASTTRIVRARTEIALPDISAGTYVLIDGPRAEDGSVSAITVHVFDGPDDAGNPTAPLLP